MFPQTQHRSLLAFLLLIWALPPGGCSDHGSGRASQPHLRIVCTMFPVYAFTRNVVKGSKDVEVDLLMPATAGCPHDYAPTVHDMWKLAQADVLLANGLGMEEFLAKAVRQANPKLPVIEAAAGQKDLLPLSDHAHEQPHAREPGAEQGAAVNPHLFASPRRAAAMVRRIGDELAKADPAQADLYRKNAADYAAKLDALADEFAAGAVRFKSRKIITQHAVFDYLARDAGLEVVAVVAENPGQELSATAMMELVKTARAAHAAAVFTEPQYSDRIARTIAREAGMPAALLDPVASGAENSPLDYYENTMRANLDTLHKVLDGP